MNRSAIFTQAHTQAKLAKTLYGGDYAAYFSFYLKALYSKQVAPKKELDLQAICEKIEKHRFVSAYISGDKIAGTFRGKTSETYLFDPHTNTMIYNRANRWEIEEAVKNAMA